MTIHIGDAVVLVLAGMGLIALVSAATGFIRVILAHRRNMRIIRWLESADDDTGEFPPEIRRDLAEIERDMRRKGTL